MKQTLFIALIFIFCINQTGLAQVTVAIADFENQSDTFYLDTWEKSIPEYLKSELSGSENIIIVERRQLESVLREQALSMTGLVDSSTAQKIGDLVGAQFVITGTINKSGGWTRIDAKIIRVVTGHVKSEKVRAKDDEHLDEMVQLLANNILHILVGNVSYQEKIELKKCPTTYFLIASVGLVASTVILNNAYKNKLDEYHNATNLVQFDPAYDSANRLYKIRNILAYTTGVALVGAVYCWIRNISPNEILASTNDFDKQIIPTLALDLDNGFQAGVVIQF
jgi:TolB-like protein